MERIVINEYVTTWVKHIVDVKNVKSPTEAINKVIKCYERGDNIYCDSDIDYLETEFIGDIESIPTEKNNGVATIEILNEKGNVVWDNGKVC